MLRFSSSIYRSRHSSNPFIVLEYDFAVIVHKQQQVDFM